MSRRNCHPEPPWCSSYREVCQRCEETFTARDGENVCPGCEEADEDARMRGRRLEGITQ